MDKPNKPTRIKARGRGKARGTARETTTLVEAAQAATDEQVVSELPAQLLAGMPETIRLWLDVPGAPTQVCFFTGPRDSHAEAHVLADTIVFDGEELNAIVCAAEADRMWHRDFLGLCFEQWRQPEFRVDAASALSGANGANPDAGQAITEQWSVERVLRRLGASLQLVEFGAAPHAQPLHVAA